MRTATATIEVTPSVKGLATIHDKDVLIYCISQLMAAVNAGRPVAPTLHLKAGELMAATGRETSGDGYRRLREAFERLSGTRIVTNIETGGIESTRGFGLIDGWEILRKARGGRMILVTVTLSDWIFRSVLSRSVLTLHRDYFRLRKPLERRVYEIARKHCGRQAEWKIGLETLLKKTGSTSPRRVFRKMIRDIAEEDGLPDYSLSVVEGDVVRVRARAPEAGEGPRLGAGDPRAGAGGGAGARPLLPRGRVAALLGGERQAAAPEPGRGLPRLRPGAGGAGIGAGRAQTFRARNASAVHKGFAGVAGKLVERGEVLVRARGVPRS